LALLLTTVACCNTIVAGEPLSRLENFSDFNALYTGFFEKCKTI